MAHSRAHQLFPWNVTWDNHEVDNNYADDKDQDGSRREDFLERRASAYQAYYEHMSLRRTAAPKGSKLDLYRGLTYGDLADFSVLHTRQYRTDQPCGDGNKPQCTDVSLPHGTLLGEHQERWLFQCLSKSRARWNVLGQQVLMAKVDRIAGPERAYAMDQWSGHEEARKRVLRIRSFSQAIHSNWVCDLKLILTVLNPP
jgi:alkaline phosphatase D